MSETLDELHARYSVLIDDVSARVFAPPTVFGDNAGKPSSNFDYAGFHSDSIVLVSKALDGTDVHGVAFSFFAAISQLLEEGFVCNLPFRGCIGLGNVLVDEERRILLSEVLPSLICAEKLQEWTGCIVHPDAEARALALLFGGEPPPLRPSLLVRYLVPVKKEQFPASALCINWMSFMSDRTLEGAIKYLISPKQENTQRFARYVRQLPDVVVNMSGKILPTSTLSIRMLVARGGVRLKFLDEHEEAHDPPSSVFQAFSASAEGVEPPITLLGVMFAMYMELAAITASESQTSRELARWADDGGAIS